MPVIPRDEIGTSVRPFQPNTGDIQPRVFSSAGSKNHGVVKRAELGKRNVSTISDIAKEADITAVQDLM